MTKHCCYHDCVTSNANLWIVKYGY
jgi:hypothetical protein